MKDSVKEPAAKYPVNDDEEGQRLDNYLFRRLKGVPKGYVYKIIRDGQVRLNGGRAKPTTRISAGDIVRVPPLRRGHERELPSDLGEKLAHPDILYEDNDLLLVAKPPGLAAHSGTGQRVGLIELLRLKRSGYLELAHRLDKETSGVIALAKNGVTLRSLAEGFKSSKSLGHITKTYLALIVGRWHGGARDIKQSLETVRAPGASKRSVASLSGRQAFSVFTPLERYADFTLMQVELKTGRLHQVRAHAQTIGYPVAGDRVYGDRGTNRALRALGLKRQFLHASSLSLAHPRSGEILKVEAPLPDDLEGVLSRLRQEDSHA